ncbi:PREDICTED: regulator of microtubule dynamics protein 1-like [Vollenhovia emeryi]|uniref:regulator of microtubule dynamics protein 1-like n=1 Tax=Vollenhovia emeryi TaxID=411798 RepID=UPI0005F55118|nr:PREDICTED: regulator of microtubule dynamics protein 1-like [Vollenhovia emeryi]XP_011871322.1 PREDICTED: regulator of microtubule dynamics protein 1-like [Vollenhovia emeryi]XP_011871323.1 PREDICTED: regulator of microtubule dynamics protein 1-like [Vollenhovia emeryi]XP_011871324.1 PREDICTED: regulator of microtubule dynamics protein 1-like [Vollenhovia emeryi]
MSQLQTNLIAAAIGATIGVISAASIFIYQKVLEKQQHAMKNEHLDEVDRRLTELQAELERLRVQQNQQRKKKKVNSKRDNDSTYVTTDNDTDLDFSTAGDDEYFDCSDSENGISDIENRTTEATCPGLDLAVLDAQHQQGGREEDDYLQLRSLIDTYPDSVDVVWRFARSCYKYSNCTTDANVRKAVICAGIDACEKLLDVANADLHKWCAILVGVNGDFLPTAERIKNGYRFKEHVMRALEIRPNDADLHHLLGRFRYEVANLSWIERKIAATLFSEPPSASYEDAIDSFQKAEDFSVKINLENRLFLSKCYIALGNYEPACQWLEKICNMSVTSEDDARVQNDARQLLAKYSGY